LCPTTLSLVLLLSISLTLLPVRCSIFLRLSSAAASIFLVAIYLVRSRATIFFGTLAPLAPNAFARSLFSRRPPLALSF
jgi:hypothetical protein